MTKTFFLALDKSKRKRKRQSRPPWVWRFAILLTVFALVSIGYMACVISLLSSGFMIPPQDCMGTTFAVQGYVVDEAERPIEDATITAWNDGSFEREAFSHVTTSDADGYFITDSAFSYGCTPFQVKVTAPQFETETQTYYPPANEGWPDELPEQITIQLRPTSN